MNITAIVSGGLDRALSRLDQTAQRLASTTEPSAGDMVSLISARNQFSSNIKVLKTADEIERRAIDLLA